MQTFNTSTPITVSEAGQPDKVYDKWVISQATIIPGDKAQIFITFKRYSIINGALPSSDKVMHITDAVGDNVLGSPAVAMFQAIVQKAISLRIIS